MLIKKPINLKISIHKKKSFYLIKFLNKQGLIKKKFNSQFIKITNFQDNILVEEAPLTLKKPLNHIKKMKIKNILFTYVIIIKQIIINMFKPTKHRLILEGVGFKIWKKKRCLKLKLGFSAPVFLNIPTGIKVSLYKQRKITISGLNAQYLGIFKQKLRSLKFPDAYKKKGIRIWGELFKLKAGKKTR